jgi:hypothetical protein
MDLVKLGEMRQREKQKANTCGKAARETVNELGLKVDNLAREGKAEAQGRTNNVEPKTQ